MESISQNPFTEGAFTDVLDAIFEVIPFKSVEDYKSTANKLASFTLSHRNLCDLELILNGGFAPLTSFMNKADYESVLERMHLSDGTIWPIPITLDVDQRFAESIKSGQEIALRDANGLLVAILIVNDIWQADKKNEALAVYNTLDEKHPGVSSLLYQVKDFYVSGELFSISVPQHFDYQHLRFTPNELKTVFQEQGWKKIVAFHTFNPMHKADRDLTLHAAKITGAKLLVQPAMGVSQIADFNHYHRIRCYEHLMKTYPEKLALLSLLPLATRMAGPREALWHAIIRKNYGCTHFIVGRHHASPAKNQHGQRYHRPYDAQTLALTYQNEIGIEIVPFHEHMNTKKKSRFFPVFNFRKKAEIIPFTGTELHDRLSNHQDVPEEFSYPEVIAELRKAYPSRLQQGFTILLTGLPRSGKSTIASGLLLRLREMTGRQITLLDNGEIRSQLTLGLGISAKDLDLSIKRLGFVAKEITRHNGIVICEVPGSSVKARNTIREMVSQSGGFIEVHVSTPISVCEKRDMQGVYGRTRGGQIKQLAKAASRFEAPVSAEVEIDTSYIHPKDVIEILVKEIRLLGYIE